MKKILMVLLASMLVSGLVFGQFTRVAEIAMPTDGGASFGNILPGVDLDGDGMMEIYAINNNWSDGSITGELVPKIWKYEFKGENAGFELVWSAVLDYIPKQNTWPPLTCGDLDSDGKMEVIWGPINFTYGANPNPSRVVVFEVKGDGSDELGIADGNGNYTPNAQWNLNSADNANDRPFKWVVDDMDLDGTNELIMVTRAGDYHYVIASVDDVPDNGDGSETWTMEAYDTGNTLGTAYDMLYMDKALYHISSAGNITKVSFDGDNYVQHQTTSGQTLGSWNSATAVNIDGDETMEGIMASWSSSGQDVYLLQPVDDTLAVTVIANFADEISTDGRLYGTGTGDIDGDDLMDFVFGSRGASPDGAILRLEYKGGDITDAANYEKSVIDQEYWSEAGYRWMHVFIAELDGDPFQEVVYGEGTGAVAPMVVLDAEGSLPVELTSFAASVVNGDVKLDWTTATEQNNKGFEIQRKSENSDYRTIAFIDGYGTSAEAHSYSFVDDVTTTVGQFTYRLVQVDFSGEIAYSNEVEVDLSAPADFALAQNYPNPFNPSTKINFSLPASASVNLKIYNMLGQEVVSLINGESFDAGSHTVNFNASQLASGTYIYTISAGDFTASRKMTLLK